MKTAAEKMKKVLVLGAGYVSAPLVEYLTRDDSVHVIIGTLLAAFTFCLSCGM